MLTLWGSKRSSLCDGISRRSFLKIGALGAGLSLPDLLRAKALGAAPPSAARAKAVIMVFLEGGPAHQDTYDLKPDAPAEFRGEFKPIATNVPGVQISEHLPLQAKIWDKLAVIRSVVSVEEHADAMIYTGYPESANRTAHHPSIGAVISKVRDGVTADVPQFVCLDSQKFNASNSHHLDAGYLGVAHRPFTPDGPALRNLRLPDGVDGGRLDERKALLSTFDAVRRDLDASGSMDGMDAFVSRAFDMVASGTVRKALDLTREEPKTLQRYKGIERFLIARRLVEAGVGFVTFNHAFWDTHADNFKHLRMRLPDLDRGIATLIEDLHSRGMENDVVTVCWGEFGRTPKINNNAGRDHWGPVMSALIAGGGLKMGQAIGSTDARAAHAKDRPYSVPQVLSTIYRAIGIDAAMTFPNGSGRPMYLLDDREPVSELL